MTSHVEELAEAALGFLQEIPFNNRVLIGLCGIPGSGKTTLASRVVQEINDRAKKEVAIVIPMDGFHLSRAALDLLPNPEEAHFRRGASFTFDPQSFLKLIRTLQVPIRVSEADLKTVPDTTQNAASIVWAPSFDHAVKDPVQDSIPIKPNHRICLFEGLYLALSMPIWVDIANSFHERWYLKCPEEVAKARLVRRHILAGICKGEAEATARAEQNDLPNGEVIKQNMVLPMRIIPYMDDIPAMTADESTEPNSSRTAVEGNFIGN